MIDNTAAVIMNHRESAVYYVGKWEKLEKSKKITKIGLKNSAYEPHFQGQKKNRKRR